MTCLNNKNYVEVIDKRYIFHPNENVKLRERKEPKSIRFRYQVQNNMKIRKNEKVFKNDNDELELERYPRKKKLKIEKLKYILPSRASRKQNV